MRDQLVEPLPVGLAAGDRERQDQVLLGGEHRQQVEELEDEAELVAAQLGQRAVVEPGDLDAVELDRAGGRLVEPGEDVHQGRLARARGSHDRREAAALEAGADVDQGVDRGFALAVAARDARGDDDLSVREPYRHEAITQFTRPMNAQPARSTVDGTWIACDADGAGGRIRRVPGRPRRGGLGRARAGARRGRGAARSCSRAVRRSSSSPTTPAGRRTPMPSGCGEAGVRGCATTVSSPPATVTAQLAAERVGRGRRPPS